MFLHSVSRVFSSTPRPAFRALLLGPPGSGKGTYGSLLQQAFDLESFSSGELIREEIKRGTAEGKEMNDICLAGGMLPPKMIMPLVDKRMFADDAPPAWLLDGFPRTLDQAEALDQVFVERQDKECISLVVNFTLPDDVIIDKILNRWGCPNCGANYNLAHIVDPSRKLNMPALPPKVPHQCDHCSTKLTQRHDDTKEIITARLATYEELSRPLIEYYSEVSPHTNHKPIFLHMDASGGKKNVWPLLEAFTVKAFPHLVR